MSIIIVGLDYPKEMREVQTRNRGDGENRYIVNLPKNLCDKLTMKYKDRKGIYRIECVDLIIENGKLFLEFDETKED